MSGDLPAPLSKPAGADLRRGLSSLHVIAIVVSAMIGVGIFIRSASMMQGVGTAPLLVIAWIAGGLLTLAGALSYAELCTLMPRAAEANTYFCARHSGDGLRSSSAGCDSS